MVLMEGITKEDTKTKMELIKKEFEKESQKIPFSKDSYLENPITFSCGISNWPEDISENDLNEVASDLIKQMKILNMHNSKNKSKIISWVKVFGLH